MTALTTDEQDSADMARLNAGEDAALNDLMERHSERLFHYLIRQLQNQTDAADLAEEAFVRVYENRSRYDPRQKFSTWLYAIATNLARDRLRWRARHPSVSLEAENPLSGHDLREIIAEPGRNPSDALQWAERAEAVRRAIGELPEELRSSLILFEYENRSHQEIASILRCSPKAVETRLYRARQQLRARLAKIIEHT